MQRFLLQQFAGEYVENIPVVAENLPGLGVCGLDQLAHLIVDVARHLVAVIGLIAHGAAQERVAVFGAVSHRSELRAHAVLGDHRAGDFGGLLDVGDRAGGGLPEHQFLGGATAHREDQSGDHLRAGHQALVVLGN